MHRGPYPGDSEAVYSNGDGADAGSPGSRHGAPQEGRQEAGLEVGSRHRRLLADAQQCRRTTS